MTVALLGFFLMLVGYGVMFRRLRRRRIGSATAGITYDLLNQDKREAVELIVDDRAAATDPETKDGDLPKLQTDRGRRRS